MMGFVQSTLALWLVFRSATQTKVYKFVVTTAALTLVGALTSAAPKIVGGWNGLIFDDATDQFFSLTGTNYAPIAATTVVRTKAFYPMNVVAGPTE